MKHSANTTLSARTPGRFGLAALLAAGVAMAPLSSAFANASITWGAVTNETGNASDVVTTGTFVDSATANSAGATVNGVTFNGETSSSGTVGFTSSNITVSNVIASLSGNAPPAATAGWNTNYATLVHSVIAGNNVGSVITIGGLTVGQSYLVQIFESPWDLNWATAFTDGSNSSGDLALYGGAVGGGVSPASSVTQYVTGTFTATGTSESIDMVGANSLSLVGALQVRDISSNNTPNVPEPSDLAILAGAGAAFLILRRGKKGNRSSNA